MLALIIVLTFPPVERYWVLRLSPVPSAPFSALLLIFVATIFLLVATAFLYVCGVLIVRVVQIERRSVAGTMPGLMPALPVNPQTPLTATGGSFIPNSDEALYMREQFELLKKQGFLTDTDTMDLETMAKEIGLKTILKERGRTE
jgi:hypothetical protein